jgi:hypothetical protein
VACVVGMRDDPFRGAPGAVLAVGAGAWGRDPLARRPRCGGAGGCA